MSAKPRITIALSHDGAAFEMYLNEAGRDRLIAELQAMDDNHEHLHLDPDEGGDLQLSAIPYAEGQTVVRYGKIYLRKDGWDRTYFPHVMGEQAK